MAANDNLVKRLAKRSFRLHASYKLAKIVRQVPLLHWTSMHRTRSIWRVLPNTMLPAARLFNAYDLTLRVEREGIAGDIAECGVWSGGGIGLMALASRRAGNKTRRFHLFDSFEGLPPPSPQDRDVIPDFRQYHPDAPLHDGSKATLRPIQACVGGSAQQVRDFLTNRLRLDPARCVFHVGWFQDTVPACRDSIGPLAILRIDGDWYESTKVCLEGLYDRVVPGGFVIIDDYGTFAGCHQAVDEFLRSRGLDSAMLVSVDGECVWFRKPA